MFKLNLREKLIGSLILFVALYIVISVTFFRDFRTFNEKTKVLNHVEKLHNLCLEIKTYERDFIIHNDMYDYDTTLKHIDEIFNYLPVINSSLNSVSHKIPDYINDTSCRYKLQKFKEKLKEYRTQFTKITQQKNLTDTEDKLSYTAGLIQNMENDIINSSSALVACVQQEKNIFYQKTQMRHTMYLITHILFTAILFYYIYRNIIVPLRFIDDVAHSVSIGSFKPLQVDEKRDETQSVIMAFNTMAQNIEKYQEQLFQATKLSSIGTLASGTAHQLNNPLNNISTSCQIALEELKQGDCEFIEGMLKIIEQESNRASEIVKGLLEFSRVQNFSMMPASLDEITNRVLKLATNEKGEGIRLEKVFPEGDFILNVDPHKITEALLNLVINGIQAIREETGTVSIHAIADRCSSTGIITVSDTGTGIAPEDIHKIFDPFYTTKRAGKGTGLGLAMVYAIIRKHRGTIRVKSGKGKGTEFVITLPLAENMEKAENST